MPRLAATLEIATAHMVRTITELPDDFVDECGHARLTLLAEDFVDLWVMDDCDTLDDPDHWIWEAPIAAAKATGTLEA